MTARRVPPTPPLDTFTHNQLVPSAQWVIEHNLNKNPSVDIVDSAGTHVLGDTRYDDINQCTITFSAPFSGRAFLN